MFLSKKDKNSILDKLNMIISKLNIILNRMVDISKKIEILALANIDVTNQIKNSNKGEKKEDEEVSDSIQG